MEEFKQPANQGAHHAAAAQPEFPAPADTGNKKGKMSKMGKPSGKTATISILIIVVLIIAVLAAIFFWHKYNDSQKQVEKLSNSPTIQAQQQTAALIASVGKLTQLPTGEQPTIATVTDISKLSDQAFFANAKNGDKVLIYTTAKEAYLYRPSTNKIINIAPVNLGSSSSTTGSSTTTNSTTTNSATSNSSTTKKQ